MAAKIDIEALKIYKIQSKWSWKPAKNKNSQYRLKIYRF